MYIYMYMGEANNRDINNKFCKHSLTAAISVPLVRKKITHWDHSVDFLFKASVVVDNIIVRVTYPSLKSQSQILSKKWIKNGKTIYSQQFNILLSFNMFHM